jgi:CRISPR/Cas system-associated exonuclease Cas4 (RecB family)
MATVILVIVAVSASMLITAWLIARSTGVRLGAAVVGSDVGIGQPVSLSDTALGLCGRPDLLLRERGRRRIYPVEVKPTRDSSTLYQSDALQLAAYMLLAESSYGTSFAGYGIVRYRSAEFRVTLSPELRRQCLEAAEGVRAARRASSVHRSHRVVGKCHACAVRTKCDEALA